MRYSTLCGRFAREAYCHVPGDEPFDLDALVSGDDLERWSGPGEPTVYLAGDVGVALAELGRHTRRLPPPAAGESRRRIFRVRAGLDRVLDLTRPETVAALGLVDPHATFLSRERARELGRRVRESGDCDGIVVPSVAFLDQPDRWNLVVFVERVSDGLALAIESPEEVGLVSFSAHRQEA